MHLEGINTLFSLLFQWRDVYSFRRMEKLLETPSKRGFPTEGGVESVGLGVKIDGFPIVFSKDPQLFRLRRCEVVEGFSISFGNIHIEVVVGDDTD